VNRRRSLVVVIILVAALAALTASIAFARGAASPAARALTSGLRGGVQGSETISITHSLSQDILSEHSYSCDEAGFNATNRWFRRFTLADFGVISDFGVKGVEVGFEEIVVVDGETTPGHLRLYRWDPATAFEFDNLELIISEEVQLSDLALGKIMFPMSLTLPATATVAVEFLVPSSFVSGNSIVVGSNDQGQTDATFVIAPQCDVDDLTDVAELGYGDMHLVLNLYGNTWVPMPEISLDKTVGLNPDECSEFDSLAIPPGGGGTMVAYCYTATNTGDVVLTSHDLEDDMIGTLMSSMPYELAPGESYSTIVTEMITEATVNLATWTGHSDGDWPPVSAQDTATVTIGAPSAVTVSELGASDGGAAAGPGWLAALGLLLFAAAMFLRRRAAAKRA
jgi:hypothetical protein